MIQPVLLLRNDRAFPVIRYNRYHSHGPLLGNHVGMMVILMIIRRSHFRRIIAIGLCPGEADPTFTDDYPCAPDDYGQQHEPAVRHDTEPEPSFIGLVNGDTAASLTAPAVLSTTATGTSPPGTYPITVSGASSADYSITYMGGAFTVLQSPTFSSLEGPILRSTVTSPATFTVDVSPPRRARSR